MRYLELAGGVFVLSFAFVISGCATIVSGTTQKVNVTSQPSDAIAKVDNNLTMKTPAVFTLERRHDHTMEISKEGYKTVTILFKRTFNGMVTGNILIGGIIGTGIDAASGSMNKIVPERVDIILEAGEGNSSVPKFVSQKDQQYYENTILKLGQPAKDQDKKPEAPAPSTAQTNFSSANTTPAALVQPTAELAASVSEQDRTEANQMFDSALKKV